MRTRTLLLLAVPCALLAQTYQDPHAPLETRVDNLVSRMTLEEKVSQMQNAAPAIPRLGIPAYNWWNEALHGVARAGRATVFPQAIGLAATFDPDQIFRVATVISTEARAKHQEYLRHNKHNIYEGLTFWSPNINLFRDPRWGRGMETYGEDPYLTGRLAVAFVKGMQGDDPKYFKTIATAKHYAVHSGPEPLRHEFDAVISDQDLFQTYLPQFEAAIEQGGADSVMCSYNSFDGKPACANPRLLTDILRGQWGFKGYVVSDCGAIGDIYKNHKFVATAEEGVAAAIKAGTDLSCGTEYSNAVAAVHAGLLSEADIDRSVKRLFTARFRLGEFDPPEMVKYAQIPYSENDSPAHRALALETARKSIVLLKNDHNALPLKKSIPSIAVIGPNADDWDALVGNYNGTPSEPVTVLEGLRRKLPNAKIRFARGSDLAANLPTFDTIPGAALFTADHKNGLDAQYFNASKFDGTQPLFTRVDRQVDFEWWDGAPRNDMNDDFGVRWTGFLRAPVSGTYQLGAIGENAFELYLDNEQIVHFSSIHHGVYNWAPVTLEAGKLYPIRLDYHEFVNDASIRLVWSGPRPPDAQEAVDAARESDAVVMVLGLSPRLEGEEMAVHVAGFNGGDRVDLGLPRVQEDLLEKIAALNKPTVLVLMNGSAVTINWARDHIPAIVEAWYPGEEGGDAVADVLFGDYNPAGRLPVTFYRSVDDLPPFTDYSMKNRTYRFFTGQPLFPFGYGLSYTTFAYRALKIPKQLKAGQPAQVSVEVQNSGARDGDEVVEMYLNRALAGVERIPLRAKERKIVYFTVTPRDAGKVQISVGGKFPGVVSSTVEVK